MSSGSKEFNTSTYILASLDWSESEINVTNNTSKVTVSLWYKRTNWYGGTTSDAGYNYVVKIDGSDYVVGSSLAIAGYDNSWYKVGEASKVITHSNDGSKSISIGCYHSCPGSLFNCDASWTVALDTIPRASVPTIAPSTLFLSEAQNTITVNTNRKSASFTHNMRLEVGEQKYYADGVGESTTFDIPYTDISQFSSTSTTLTGYLYCTTYNGSTTIGATQRTSFTLSIDTSQEHPSIGSITLTDTNSKSAAVESSGSFIRTASNLHAVISISAVGSYTELASAVVQCGNLQQTYALSGTSRSIVFDYPKLDANSIVVTVYDERGTSRTSTRNWTLIPYQNLTVVGAVDRKTETGSQIRFSIQGQCFAGSFGQATNQITVSYRFKNHASSDYLTRQETFTFTPTGSGESTYDVSYEIGNFTIDDEEYFSYDQQYDLILTVTDLFTTDSTGTLVLTKGIPVYGNGEDFFSIYGQQYLHYDRDNPSKFWDINDALNGILDHYGIKNLLPSPTVQTTTVNGVTFSVSEDGAVTATGSATEYAVFTLCNFQTESGKEYILSGCPAGGGRFTYDVGIGSLGTDTGDGFEFTGDGTSLAVTIAVFNGVTVDDVVFNPMVRDARIASESYVTPYSPIRCNNSGIWFRVQFGRVLILLCTNSVGGQLQFGVTFDSVPFVLTGASQGSYGHGTTNQQIWDLTTSSMRWDARYGEVTKYPASIMVIGLYSGQI